MRKRHPYPQFLLVWLLLVATTLPAWAQPVEETDDLGQVTDAFQEHFFEALKQKAIENYDRALDALHKAETEKPGEVAVAFEMGNNYLLLQRYHEAEGQFKKALTLAGEKPEILQGLFEAYRQTNDHANALKIGEKLLPRYPTYKEEMAELYLQAGKHARALQLLDELDHALGESEHRNRLRQTAYRNNDSGNAPAADLQQRIAREPKNEQHYHNLIDLHQQAGDSQAAFETARLWVENLPNSTQAHLRLYSFYLQSNQADQARKSIEIILNASDVSPANKLSVLRDFLQFADQKTEHQNTWESLADQLATTENSPEIYEGVGRFFWDKNDPAKALHYFEKGLEQNPMHFGLLKSALPLQLDSGAYEKAHRASEEALAAYPAQALFYLRNGQALNGLKQPKKAIDILEMGLDFVIDDPEGQQAFYQALRNAHQAAGNTQKTAEYAGKLGE